MSDEVTIRGFAATLFSGAHIVARRTSPWNKANGTVSAIVSSENYVPVD